MYDVAGIPSFGDVRSERRIQHLEFVTYSHCECFCHIIAESECHDGSSIRDSAYLACHNNDN